MEKSLNLLIGGVLAASVFVAVDANHIRLFPVFFGSTSNSFAAHRAVLSLSLSLSLSQLEPLARDLKGLCAVVYGGSTDSEDASMRLDEFQKMSPIDKAEALLKGCV